MPVNPAVEGRTYRMPQAHVVTRDEIVTFARAVRTSDDRCLDVDAARACLELLRDQDAGRAGLLTVSAENPPTATAPAPAGPTRCAT